MEVAARSAVEFPLRRLATAPVSRFWPVVLAAIVGVFAWSGADWTIGLLALLPLLWSAAHSRWHSGAVILAYQLAATRDAPISMARYYHSVIGTGLALWLCGGVIVAATWLLCWRQSRWGRVVGAAFALLLTAVPPIGIVGWVHPLAAAGTLLPGASFIGLFAFTAALALSTRISLRWLPLSAAIVLSVGYGVSHHAVLPPDGWTGLDTRHPFGAVAEDPARDYRRQLALIRAVKESSARIVVLPESAGGLWTDVAADLWLRSLATTDKTVLLGAELGNDDGSTTNALLSIASGTVTVAYKQRMPVPLSMWRPFGRNGTRAHWLQNPIVDVAGTRVAVLVCYEQLLPWTVLHSLAQRPRVVVACSNDWWCSESKLPSMQRQTLLSWCRLFGVPVVSATNL